MGTRFSSGCCCSPITCEEFADCFADRMAQVHITGIATGGTDGCDSCEDMNGTYFIPVVLGGGGPSSEVGCCWSHQLFFGATVPPCHSSEGNGVVHFEVFYTIATQLAKIRATLSFTVPDFPAGGVTFEWRLDDVSAANLQLLCSGSPEPGAGIQLPYVGQIVAEGILGADFGCATDFDDDQYERDPFSTLGCDGTFSVCDLGFLF